MQAIWIGKDISVEMAKDRLFQAKAVGLDTETTGLDPLTCQLRLVQLYPEGQGGDVLLYDTFSQDDEITDLIDKLLYSSDIVKIGHNLKFDLRFLFHHLKINQTPQALFDTYLISQVLAGGDRMQGMSLQACVNRHLQRWMEKDEQKSNWDVDELSESQIRYACEDVVVLPELRHKLIAELREYDLERVAQIECEALPAMAAMENRGIHLDRNLWSELLAEKVETLAAVEKELTEKMQAGVDWTERTKKGRRPGKPKIKKSDPNFVQAWQYYEARVAAWEAIPETFVPTINLRSPDQVKKALKNLGIPIGDSTREQFLSTLAGKYPILDLLLDHRGWAKSVSSYGESFLNACDKDSRIHAEYRQIGTGTGRMSTGGGTAGVNIQQVPNRDEIGQRHRRCFTAPEGRKLVIADYSQLELRILAEFAGESHTIDAFNNGEDLHTATAAIMFGVPYDQVQKAQRSAAKNINYGLAYGMGPEKLASTLRISREEAMELMSRWAAAFGKTKNWLTKAEQFAQRFQHTRSAWGRITNFFFDPYVKSQVAAAGREGKNAPLQSTNADMLKRAAYLVHLGLVESGVDGGIVALVHDEIVLEVAEDDAEYAAKILKSGMEQAGSEVLRRVSCPVDTLITGEWIK